MYDACSSLLVHTGIRRCQQLKTLHSYKYQLVYFSTVHQHHTSTAAISSLPNAGCPTPTPKCFDNWVSTYGLSQYLMHSQLFLQTSHSLLLLTLFCFLHFSDTTGPNSEDSASSVNTLHKLKKVLHTISGLESKLLGNNYN